MNVCVLGAGIVGLATAYELNRQGVNVTVIDCAKSGSGASGGNGAQLSYNYVQPLADASIWAQLPKLLLSSESPLKIRPKWDVQQWRWGLAFLRACNANTSARSTASLLALAALSRTGFDRMLAAENLDCDYSNTGKLLLYSTVTAFDTAQRQLALQRELGSRQVDITAQQCCDLEPSLVNYQSHIAGAIYTPSECAVDCLKLCLELERVLRAKGVQFHLETAVTSLELQHRRVVAVHTAEGAIIVDHVVLALGNDSVKLARTVGIRLPIYPIKGYSITLHAAHAEKHAMPKISITDTSRKVVFAPLGSRLRVAGMAELVGSDRSISPQAIKRLQNSVQALFPQLHDCAVAQPWAGLRPATPTGLPIVGTQAGGPSNLIVNTGHGSLGLTLAFGTAHQVTEQVLRSKNHSKKLPSRSVKPSGGAKTANVAEQ